IIQRLPPPADCTWLGHIYGCATLNGHVRISMSGKRCAIACGIPLLNGLASLSNASMIVGLLPIPISSFEGQTRIWTPKRLNNAYEDFLLSGLKVAQRVMLRLQSC